MIIADNAPAGSPYDQWKVYRSTSKAGSYSVIVTQNLTDLSYYDTDGGSSHWYKISYYDSSGATESALSDAQRGLAETYTTVKKVERFMRLSSVSDTTTPNIQDIIELINRAEDRIDYKTGHAWRERFCGTNTGLDMTAKYEYYDINYRYEAQSGRPIYLNHREIRTFSSDDGDTIEVWDGSSWENWLTGKTEGRDEDYWLDYEQGILYLRTRYRTGSRKLRVKYRYGSDFVNKMVEDIATKIVGIDILGQASTTVMLPDCPSGLSYTEKVKLWQDQINEDMTGLKEFQVMSTML